jgi:hypothetical protein
MGRSWQDRQLGARDALGDDPAKPRRGGDVELPSQHQRWHPQPGQAVQGVVGHEGVQLPLEGIHGLGMGRGQGLGDEPLNGPVGMRLWRVDPQEEGLEGGTLARGDLHQPVPKLGHGAQVGIGASPGADQHQAADQLAVAQRQLLGDDAPAREAHDMGGRDLQSPQQASRVVGHGGHRERLVGWGQRRAARPTVVEGRQPPAVRQPLQLRLPGLGGITEPGNQQTSGPCPRRSIQSPTLPLLIISPIVPPPRSLQHLGRA